jgi:hypothetical protein
MENVRIDKGVKRGKRTSAGIPRISTTRRRNEEGQVEAIPADLDPKLVLQQYLDASTTSQIAAQYGIKRKSLTQWLRKTCPEEWKQVQIVKAHCQKEDANEGLAEAPDALSLARARELLRSAQYDLTALDPDYQPKQHVTVDINVDLGDRLLRAEQRVIEGDSTLIQQDAPQQSGETGVVLAQHVISKE